MRPEDIPQAAVDAVAEKILPDSKWPATTRSQARAYIAAALPRLVDDAMVERTARAMLYIKVADDQLVLPGELAEARRILRAALGVSADAR